MAKYWKHLKYHEDKIKKRRISSEEITFLSNLQKEMNTQDTVGQADPRYWVIRDFKRNYGERLNNPSGMCVVKYDDGSTILDIEYESIMEMDCAEQIIDGMRKIYPEYFEDDDELSGIFDMSDLKDFIEDHGIDVRLVEYEIVPEYCGFFLTQSAAEKHLRLNHYRYNENASTYAMTAWRNEEADKLYKILQEVDFEELRKERNNDM